MGAKYEIEGRLHYVGPVVNVSETFKKRDVIVVQEGQYPNYVKLQAGKDKTVIFDHAQPGDRVKIAFYLNGKLTNDKEGRETVWNNLNIQEVTYLEKAAFPEPTTGIHHAPATAADLYGAPKAQPSQTTTDFDDVPF